MFGDYIFPKRSPIRRPVQYKRLNAKRVQPQFLHGCLDLLASIFCNFFAMVLHVGNCRNCDFLGGGRQKEISEILEFGAP